MNTEKASGLLSSFSRQLPQWSTGLASRGLMLHHLSSLLALPHSTDIIELGHSLASWRFQLFPWDVQTLNTATALAKLTGRPSLPSWAQRQSQLEHHFGPAIQAIAEGRSDDVIMLWMQHGRTSHNFAWLGEIGLFFMQRGDEAHARMVLETTCIPAAHPIHIHLRALLAFCFDPPEAAILQIHNLPHEFKWLRLLLEAQTLVRLGEHAGTEALIMLWREMPWHANLTLKLHGLLSPPSKPVAPNADTAVLVYSWNNADLLQQTLRSLSQSELGEASLLVLDNGSSDHTPSVIQASAELFGQRMKNLRLPVNIGAPAARNWLLRHPEASRFQTLVFVDDDVLLPPDWLTGLAAQYRQAPAGSIVGCRIMDQAPKKTVQMADVNLLDIGPDGDFLIANAGSGELDLGLHDYIRPCLSVTGCCHIMDRCHAQKLGGFDLRFGPSQFDDFDLDLRNALQGGHAIYAGRTAIRHCQRSSLNQADSEAKQGHIQGNMLKLKSKYTPDQKAMLLRRNCELLWHDLLAKTRELESL
jgi:GT2 family glycosyltransferase